ncbi:MAG: HlyD family efflux transporter periplasmic adaptor subunit, partial [Mogibacterium sp.]|nr:HlyD family efflux transporter periplasmic adaptor subunit [Mogibacterium sp.]
MAQKQTELDEIDEKIEDAEDEKGDTSIKATVTGRVKAVFVEEGDNVSAAMYEHGSLMLLSLDGHMAVDIKAEISVGDSITVTASDGKSWDGTVDHAMDGSATILLTDDGPLNGETVTVYDKEGRTLGSGELYIHQSLAVTGYVGTVSGVSVSENTKVTSGKTLIKLTDTGYTANYDALLKEREDLQKDMNELIAIYSMGGIYAPMSGQVVSVTWEEDDEQSQTDTELLAIRSNDTILLNVNVDETDILSIQEGLEASVTISSIGDDTYTGVVTEVGD